MRRSLVRFASAVCGLTGLLAALFGGVAAAAPSVSNHVVIISIDGMRPEFYLSKEFAGVCETLAGLRQAGSFAKGALPPYPSVTYPGHATIATGVHPSRHGIVANTVFEPPELEGRGYWFASDLRAPALWDVAHKAGLTVGSVSWPCTAGSKSIRWDVAEFWTTPFGNDLELTRRYAAPGLIEMIESKAGRMTPARRADAAQWDAFLAASAVAILEEHKPNLMFVHFIEADKIQHQGGCGAAELPAVLRRVDGYIHDIIEATRKAGIHERTTFIVLGDHGFEDVSRMIAPNVLLAQNGFITLSQGRVTDWKAMAQNTGGSAGVYLKDPKDIATATKVRMLFARHAMGAAGKPMYRVIEKQQLLKLGGPRDAAFYLEAEPGYMFSKSLDGDFVRPAPIKGNHGFLPTRAGMHTGFVAAGRGVKKGVQLGLIQLVDVAPTVAELLGLRLEDADGRVLNEILE